MYWVSIFCSICPTSCWIQSFPEDPVVSSKKIGPKTWPQRKGVSSLVHAVGTDAELNEEEEQILKAGEESIVFPQLEMIWKIPGIEKTHHHHLVSYIFSLIWI